MTIYCLNCSRFCTLWQPYADYLNFVNEAIDALIAVLNAMFSDRVLPDGHRIPPTLQRRLDEFAICLSVAEGARFQSGLLLSRGVL